MNKKIKMLICLLLLLITGCSLVPKQYNVLKITNYIRNTIGVKHFNIDSYTDIRDYGVVNDRYWKVYDKDNDLEFYVIDDYYWGDEHTKHKLENDYFEKYYIKYGSKIPNTSNVTYEKQDYNLLSGKPFIEAHIELKCSYTTKAELKECHNSLKRISNYFNGRAPLTYTISYYGYCNNKTETLPKCYEGRINYMKEYNPSDYYDENLLY